MIGLCDILPFLQGDTVFQQLYLRDPSSDIPRRYALEVGNNVKFSKCNCLFSNTYFIYQSILYVVFWRGRNVKGHTYACRFLLPYICELIEGFFWDKEPPAISRKQCFLNACTFMIALKRDNPKIVQTTSC